MKWLFSSPRRLSVCVLPLLLASCPSEAVKPEAPAPAEEQGDSSPSVLDEVDVASPEEALEEATSEITDENLEEELEKLSSEIEADG